MSWTEVVSRRAEARIPTKFGVFTEAGVDIRKTEIKLIGFTFRRRFLAQREP